MKINWNRRGYTEEEFRGAWAGSVSVRQVLIALGKAPMGGNYSVARKTAECLGLSSEHMLGQGHNAREASLEAQKVNKIPLHLILSGKRVYSNTSGLKGRLVDEGYFEKECSSCGGIEWMGEEIPLELDHIDGNRNNNKLKNLRMLCPNCHALTDTYRGKNKGMYSNRQREKV